MRQAAEGQKDAMGGGICDVEIAARIRTDAGNAF
jgi:hypothetical protein